MLNIKKQLDRLKFGSKVILAFSLAITPFIATEICYIEGYYKLGIAFALIFLVEIAWLLGLINR